MHLFYFCIMRVFIYICFVVLACSCSQNSTLFSEYKSIPDANWNRFNLISFNFEVKDTSIRYDVFVKMTVNKQCEVQTMLCYLDLISTSNQHRYIERLIQVQDTSNSKNSAEVKSLFLSQIKLNELGSYKIELGSLSTKYDNPGISQIGIEVVEVD